MSDSTVGYHLGRVNTDNNKKPFCGSMSSRAYTDVRLLPCEKAISVGYLCEVGPAAGHTLRSAQVPVIVSLTPPWRSIWNSSSIDVVACPKGHVTHTLLACDLSSDCWLEQSGGHSARDGVKCSAPLRPLPPSFGCRERGQYVPYTLVCDHRPDCFDSSDEDFCVFSSGDRENGDFLCGGNLTVQCDQTRQVAFCLTISWYQPQCRQIGFFFFF